MFVVNLGDMVDRSAAHLLLGLLGLQCLLGHREGLELMPLASDPLQMDQWALQVNVAQGGQQE